MKFLVWNYFRVKNWILNKFNLQKYYKSKLEVIPLIYNSKEKKINVKTNFLKILICYFLKKWKKWDRNNKSNIQKLIRLDLSTHVDLVYLTIQFKLVIVFKFNYN